MASEHTSPNWLFRGLIIISLLVHGVVFMRITELYRPKTLTYIELTMRSLSKPFVREIPRPRFRPKEPPHPEKVHRIETQTKPLPSRQPLPDAPRIDRAPDVSRERVHAPQIPSIEGVNVSDWQPDAPAAPPSTEPTGVVAPEITEEAYRDIIDRKIRGSVVYPSRAKKRNLEGRVIVSVTIGSDGEIAELKISRSSGHSLLDRTVLKTVKAAAPFSKPPRGPVTVLVPIQFKLL